MSAFASFHIGRVTEWHAGSMSVTHRSGARDRQRPSLRLKPVEGELTSSFAIAVSIVRSLCLGTQDTA